MLGEGFPIYQTHFFIPYPSTNSVQGSGLGSGTGYWVRVRWRLAGQAKPFTLPIYQTHFLSLTHQLFPQGAFPEAHSWFRASMSRTVSMQCQKPSCS